MSSAADLPLSGVTVVALEHAVAAPFATRQLCDLGARVIKLERPDGGDFARGYDDLVKGISTHFAWLNHGKESVAVDLKSAAGRRVLDTLLERTDVFVTNLAPGAVERLGVDPPTLTAKYPKLVACTISGYGYSGPFRDKRAYDLLIQCEAGLVALTGTPEVMAKAGAPVADVAGGMYAYSSIIVALFNRMRHGRGTTIEVSLFEALLEWLGHPLNFARHTGQAPPRVGLSHPVVVPYNAYDTEDGGKIVIGVQNDREWARFASDVLERPDLVTDAMFATNAARVANRAAVDALVESETLQAPAPELTRRLDAAGIANANLADVVSVLDHPHLEARGRWGVADSSVGPLTMLRSPVNMGGVEPRMGRIPALGEHTGQVLAWLGLDQEEVPAGGAA